MLWQVDTILFSLLVQRGLCDSQGHVWRSHSSQLYAVEVTQPERQVHISSAHCKCCRLRNCVEYIHVVVCLCYYPRLSPLSPLPACREAVHCREIHCSCTGHAPQRELCQAESCPASDGSQRARWLRRDGRAGVQERGLPESIPVSEETRHEPEPGPFLLHREH